MNSKRPGCRGQHIPSTCLDLSEGFVQEREERLNLPRAGHLTLYAC